MIPANVLRGPRPDNATHHSRGLWYRLMRGRVCVVAFALLLPGRLVAQAGEVQGSVRDSASGNPVAGVVVMLLGERGDVVARTLTGTRGQYRLVRPLTAVQLRAIRLGFTPRLLTLPPMHDGPASLLLTLAPVARTLQSVSTSVARGCPTPPNGAEAFGLLDQARAGLFATVVARERLPALLRVAQYQRQIGLDGVTVERQTVRVDSAVRTATSFSAGRAVEDLIDRGFRTGAAGEYTYAAPDADVLLSEQFQRGYCFSLASADSARANQRGLRFSPVRRRNGKVDVEGTIWIDTAQRVLRDVEFAFVGVDQLSASLGAGGHLGFHTLPNGLAFISQWSMRLIGARDPLASPASVQHYSIREIGGEVAEAHVGDSGSFYAPLGTAHIMAVTTDGAPVAAARIRLANTDYQAFTNASGRASIPFLLPGSYQVVVDEVALEPAGLSIPLPKRLVIPRAASTIVRVVVPSAEQFVAPLCGQEMLVPGDAWLIAKVTDANGEPMADASYAVTDLGKGSASFVFASGTVPPTGIVAVCRLPRGRDVEIAVWQSRSPVVRVQERLDRKITAVRVAMASRTMASRTVARGTIVDTASFVASGSVRDSVSGAPVANARITFLGTSLEATSDESGHFVLGGIAPGDHQVEVSTPWLDSIGAVKRTTVALNARAPITLYLPSVSETLQSSCGLAAEADGGAVVGQVTTMWSKTLPSGLRVTAEWDSVRVDVPTSVSQAASGDRLVIRSRVSASIGSGGSYRLCGVPTGRTITVYTTVDNLDGSTPQAARRSVTLATAAGSNDTLETQPFERHVWAVLVDPVRRFARLDLMLQSSSASPVQQRWTP